MVLTPWTQVEQRTSEVSWVAAFLKNFFPHTLLGLSGGQYLTHYVESDSTPNA